MAKFKLGHQKVGGKRVGSVNKTSAEVREYCAWILAQINLEKLIADLYIDEQGKHKPLTEVSARVLDRLLLYAWGQPRQELDVTVNMRDAIQSARQRVIEAQIVEQPLLPAKSVPQEGPGHPRIEKDPPVEGRGPTIPSSDLVCADGRVMSAAARERIREGQRKRRENAIKRAVAQGKAEAEGKDHPKR